jgi:L-asparagine transporter-like permease
VPTSPSDADPTGSDPEQLRRLLGRRQIVLLGLGSALGTGLFLGSGQSVAGAGPAVVLSFVAGTLIAGVVAFALGELSSVHPVRGSFGTIAARYPGPWAGFTVRWLYWLALVAATGGEVVAAAVYLRYWWPELPLGLAVAVLSLLLTAINTVNVGAFGRTEAALSLIKVIAVVVFVVMGVVLIAFGLPGRPATGLGNLTADGGFFPHGVGAIGWSWRPSCSVSPVSSWSRWRPPRPGSRRGRCARRSGRSSSGWACSTSARSR